MDHIITEQQYRDFMNRLFVAEGFTQEQAEEITEVLITADLFGIESHGAQRAMYYHTMLKEKGVKLHEQAEIIKETPVSALIDGHFAMGQLTSTFAMKTAIKKAKETGIGIVCVRRSNHYGIAGYYTLMALKEGLASISLTNTGPLMVPTFGQQMMLGTNPIAFAMPAEPYPFWFDAATTVIPLGKVEVYNKREKQLPEGWVIKPDGEYDRDAKHANEEILAYNPGGILPLGGRGEENSGHKGYGLAIMVEALTSILSGGALPTEMSGPHGDHTCHFFLAFDPEMFRGLEDVKEQMSRYLQNLRDSEKLPGHDRIYTPGEKAFTRQADRKKNGIPIEDKTFQELNIIAKELGIETL